MEDSQVAPSSEQPTLAEWLDAQCEYYMSMGVPYDEFWFGDYCKLKYYEKRYFNRQRQKNYEMWQMGMYVLKAFETVIAGCFGSNSKVQYPSLPFGEETPEEEKTPEQLQAEITAQLKATIRETR